MLVVCFGFRVFKYVFDWFETGMEFLYGVFLSNGLFDRLCFGFPLGVVVGSRRL